MPLVGEDGGEPNTERWWESDQILVITSLRGGDMVHMLFYQRDDDEEDVPWGHELGPDHLPLGTKDRLYHRAEDDDDDHDRVWTLYRLIGLPSSLVPGITGRLAVACNWIAGDGTDVQKAN